MIKLDTQIALNVLWRIICTASVVVLCVLTLTQWREKTIPISRGAIFGVGGWPYANTWLRFVASTVGTAAVMSAVLQHSRTQTLVSAILILTGATFAFVAAAKDFQQLNTSKCQGCNQAEFTATAAFDVITVIHPMQGKRNMEISFHPSTPFFIDTSCSHLATSGHWYN
eukprot:TRINITY_DN24311_c0_g1_i2.p2 TRINITY_DN24311_c0_g1~~TRINITY_DN24311_c0_g1_i2.p2  ORF type:complete len:169 (+),score=26.76 TRINITY_DN24311_c0_g1_i2:38-544(+)